MIPRLRTIDPRQALIYALAVANLLAWGALAAVDVFGVTIRMHVPAPVLRLFPKG